MQCVSVVGEFLLDAGLSVLSRDISNDSLQTPATVEDFDCAPGGRGMHVEGASHLLHASEMSC
jgi:hypothetical protein